jgi:hypothetical protein
LVNRYSIDESVSDVNQNGGGGRDRSYQRPSESNASRLLLPDNEPLDRNEFLTTFLSPRLITPKYNLSITTNQQNRLLSVQGENHNNNNNDDNDDEAEIQVVSSSSNIREDQLASIRNQLNGKSNPSHFLFLLSKID